MADSTPELRVEIHKLGNEYFAVTRHAAGHEICTNRFQHDPTGLTHMGPLWLLERGAVGPDVAGMELSGRAREEQVARYGLRLYRYLFGQGDQLDDFFRRAAVRRAYLTLKLHQEAAALWRLPWEYLNDGGEFLCLDGKLLLSRAPVGLPPLEFAAQPAPLRILVVIAAPDDQEELDIEREMSVVQEAVDDAIRQGHIHLDILTDATVATLRQTLKQEGYHILHYIGHGEYSYKQRRGFLCFEGETGETEAMGVAQLSPLLAAVPHLGLVIISACHSAQIGVLDAFDNLATGLLQQDIPAVLAIPSSLHDESAIELFRTFYHKVADGEQLLQALHEARQALHEVDMARQEDRRRFDWGVPALYVRRSDLRLLDPHSTPTAVSRPDPLASRPSEDTHGFPRPSPFVGRDREMRKLREVVRHQFPVIAVYGQSGVGKSAMLARWLERPGIALEGVCVIRCREMLHPLESLRQIADFWRVHGMAESATLLLNARHEPVERARHALQRIARGHHILLFEDIDHWLETEGDSVRIADETMRAILRGFLSARTGAVTLLFSGVRAWPAVANLAQRHFELNLAPMTLWPSVHLMNNLPNLRQEPLLDKSAVHARIGGYPQLFLLLDAWLADGHSLYELLNVLAVPGRSPSEWMDFLVGQLLERLTDEERTVLATLAVVVGPFTAEMVRQIAGWTAEQTHTFLSKARMLSLVRERMVSTKLPLYYEMIPPAREHLLRAMDDETRRQAHTRVATYYGQPFVKEARRHIAGRTTAAEWDDQKVAWLARSGTGILGMWIRQTYDAAHARRSLMRALAWQYHLFAAGECKAATEIVEAVVPVLERMDQSDLAEALLRRTLRAVEGVDRGQLFVKLGDRALARGKVQDAIATYEKAYQVFRSLDERGPMADALSQMAIAWEKAGDYNRAIQLQQVALTIRKELGDTRTQAESLQQLASLYLRKGDSRQALVHNRAAAALNQEHGNLAGLAMDLHQQGVILNEIGYFPKALGAFRTSLEIARRIGDKERVAGNLLEIGRLLAPTKPQEAVDALTEALNIFNQLNSPKVALVLETLGFIYEQQQQYAKALELYERALRIYETASPKEKQRCQKRIAQVREKMGA